MSGGASKTILCVGEKVQMCQYKERHPAQSQRSIAQHFSALWNKPVSRRCVGDVLGAKEKWTAQRCDAKKVGAVQHTRLEEELALWFHQAKAKSRNGLVSNKEFRTKAKELGKSLGVSGFLYSDGWLRRFKERHCIQASSRELSEVITTYSERDVYNMDESRLFFRVPPDKSCARKTRDAVTLVFCVNADGSDKRKLTVIGKSARPRTFERREVVRYRHAENGWMTSREFQRWTRDLNEDMEREGRRVLLLVDDAPCHSEADLGSVAVRFLPGCIAQPCQAGIVQSFKVQYRLLQVRHASGCSGTLALRDAVCLVGRAWDAVSAETVSGCWEHTGLVQRGAGKALPAIEMDAAMRVLGAALSETDARMTAEEFVNVDAEEPVCEETSRKDVAVHLCPEPQVSVVPVPAIVTIQEEVTVDEARKCLRTLRSFFEWNSGFSEEMSHVLALEARLESPPPVKLKKQQ